MGMMVRLLVSLVVPPVLGLIGLIFVIEIRSAEQGLMDLAADIAADLQFLLMTAFVMTLIPSLIIWLVFEFVLSRRIDAVLSYILFASLFGFLSGVFMLAQINQQVWLLHTHNLVGAAVGAVLGLIYFFLYRSKTRLS